MNMPPESEPTTMSARSNPVSNSNPQSPSEPPVPGISRRQFMTRGTGFLAWTAVGSTALDSLFAASADAQGADDDYRALVCVFLAGGNDSFNMLIPLGANGAPHPDYTSVRDKINLIAGEFDPLPLAMTADEIGAVNPEYAGYGLHAQLPFLRDEFSSGRATMLANVGNLGTLYPRYVVAGLDEREPKQLFSHNSQIDQWQTAGGAPAPRSGWVGRLGDRFTDGVDDLANNPFTFLSLAGNNVLQLGEFSENFVVNPAGAETLVRPTNGRGTLDWTFDDLGDTSRLQEAYLDILNASLDNAETYDGAWVNQTAGHVENLPGGPSITYALNGVVNHMLTSRDQAVGAPVRQVFFVIDGDYDHHSDVKKRQVDKFSDLNAALELFWTSCGQSGLRDNTVLFSCSEFGRTMVASNKGSDHGWGGNSFVMASEKNLAQSSEAGGRIHGSYPKIKASGGGYEGGRGRVIPTMAIEEYYAELALWLGVKNLPDLVGTLPHLPTRWQVPDQAAAQLPVGFLRADAVNAGVPTTVGGSTLTFVAPGSSSGAQPINLLELEQALPGVPVGSKLLSANPLSYRMPYVGSANFTLSLQFLEEPVDITPFQEIEIRASISSDRVPFLSLSTTGSRWISVTPTSEVQDDGQVILRAPVDENWQGLNSVALVVGKVGGEIATIHSILLR